MFQGIASTKKGYSKTIVYNLLYHIFAGKVKPKHFYFFTNRHAVFPIFLFIFNTKIHSHSIFRLCSAGSPQIRTNFQLAIAVPLW